MKVAIMTTFQDFNPAYSLTGIVKDQVTMLKKYEHDVHLFVCERFNKNTLGNIPAENVHEKVPFSHLKDYRSPSQMTPEHQQEVIKIGNVFSQELQGYDIAFTHDFVFTGWNMIYGLGIQRATGSLPNLGWFHWIHSVPSVETDWWDIKAYGRPRHKLVYPNKTEQVRVAEMYKGQYDDVRCIPHIKDIRTWRDFSKETCDIIDRYPGILSADIVQILPASVDRLSAKRLVEVMKIISYMKKSGKSVFLLVANQWATGKQQKEDTDKYRNIGISSGLVNQMDFAFTSDLGKEYEVGISQRMIRELFDCSNLFIFPTREESFGLVIPEAAHSGVYMVLNRSLTMMYEVSGNNVIYFDFGSHHNDFKNDAGDKYYHDIAQVVMGRMAQNETLRMKTFCRKQYNMDFLYNNYYFPYMNEMSYIIKKTNRK